MLTARITIRSETAADIAAIARVTEAAFRTLAVSHHTEQYVIDALRRAGALTLSLVAVQGDRVVGHIAFSPVTISDGAPDWYGLGPLAVLPECQRQGIGKALIHEGLARLKVAGARGCCLVGHPDYYRAIGFANVADLIHEGVPPEVFLAMSFDGTMPRGVVAFDEAFKASAPE